MAVCKGVLPVMKWLFSHGAGKDVRTPTNEGSTPLLLACACGHLEAAKWLYSHGAAEDVSVPTNKGHMPIHGAALSGHRFVVKWLRSVGAVLDDTVRIAAKEGEAAMAEDGEDAAELRKHGNAKDGKHTKLVERLERVCAGCGKQSVGKKCLRCNAVYYCSKVCQVAHWKDHKEECKKIAREAQVAASAPGGRSAATTGAWPLGKQWDFICEVSDGKRKLASLETARRAGLLTAEGMRHRESSQGATPMFFAAQEGALPVMEWLFSHGAEKDVRTPNKAGNTPMGFAANSGNVACMEWLFSHGAEKDVRAPDATGGTPLLSARATGPSRGGKVALPRYSHGAAEDVSVLINESKHRPIHMTALAGLRFIVKWLMSVGALLDDGVCDCNGQRR